MNCVTDISGIEKVYANSYNHDVKGSIVYLKQAEEDPSGELYADAEFTKPISKKLLKELFFGGVFLSASEDPSQVHYVPAKDFLYDPLADVPCIRFDVPTATTFLCYGYDAEAGRFNMP